MNESKALPQLVARKYEVQVRLRKERKAAAPAPVELGTAVEVEPGTVVEPELPRAELAASLFSEEPERAVASGQSWQVAAVERGRFEHRCGSRSRQSKWSCCNERM